MHVSAGRQPQLSNVMAVLADLCNHVSTVAK